MTTLFGGFVQELGVGGRSAREFAFSCSLFLLPLKALLLNLLELLRVETGKKKKKKKKDAYEQAGEKKK